MLELRAIHSTRAYFAHHYGTHALPMTRAKEVQVHCEHGEEDLNWESYAWLAVSSLVYNQSEVVHLENHAEVGQGTKLAHDKHGCLR